MLKLLGSPRVLSPFYLAVSGGVDSMACLDFLRNGKHEFIVAHFNHSTNHGHQAETFVRDYCKKIGQPAVFGKLSKEKPADLSQEEHWRNERYSFFDSLPVSGPGLWGPVVTCHHLDDAVETYLFYCLNGNSRTIPYKRYFGSSRTVYRPFLLTTKEELKDWAVKHDVPWIEDESNSDVVHARNRIRHNIVPEALKINPGLRKVVARKIQEGYDAGFK